MTAIIKADAAQPVRSFALLETPPAALDPRDEERSRLLDEVDQLRTQLEELQSNSKGEVARAREEGRLSGLEEAARDEEGRCAILAKGVADALRAWTNRLGEIEGLATLICRTALAKLFDDPAKLSSLVIPVISRQLQHIRRDAVVALRVSDEDFPDETALAALKAVTGPSLQIVATPDLSAGECAFDLQLGRVEISPLSQWRNLEALLVELASEDGQ